MLCEQIAAHADFCALDSIAGICVDLRYASANNFVGRNLYGELNCAWLHREAASGLALAQASLQMHRPGHRLLVLDALRPHRVQQTLWQWLAGSELQLYLADPARGSIHSFGMAVDVTVVDANGIELDMGSGFDDLRLLSHPQHEQKHVDEGLLGKSQWRNRQGLREAMRAGGFVGIPTEWWHFDFGDRAQVRRSYLRIE